MRVSRYQQYSQLRLQQNPNRINARSPHLDLIHKQSKELYCFQASYTVELPGSKLNYDTNRFLVSIAQFIRAVQTVVPTTLHQVLLHH